jgi:tetratricopeptide (TPR) repeat protein
MKGKNEDLRTVGQRLDAANVLEGSVRKAGSRVRITAQLIETGRGSHTWSQQFDRELTDVFAVQEEIARAVVAALQVKLLAAATRPARTVEPQAHDLYLRGLVLVRSGSGEGAEQAVPLLQQAVERDPSYPQAWAELGRALFLAADQGSADPKTYWPRALAAVDRAIATGSDVPDGYLARSIVRQGVQDWVGAQEDAERAQLVAPGSATALLRHGSLLRTLGRLDEAVVVVERAAALDPLAHASHQSLAFSYLGLRRYPEAEASARRALELAPQNGQTARTLGFALLLQGRLEEAREAFHRASSFLYQRMGDVMIDHTLGRSEASQRLLGELLASPDVSRWCYQVAQMYAWRGEPDRAFQWLDRATEVHDAGLQHLKNDPIIAKLAGDPRYARLLARLKLPAG